MQSVLPGRHGSWMEASFELPARSPPNQTIPTWPLASAASQGKTLGMPTVEPPLMRTAGDQLAPRSLENE